MKGLSKIALSLIVFASSSISLSAFAYSDSESFYFNGSSESRSFRLERDVFRTEVDYETYWATCYREVPVNDGSNCRMVREEVCQGPNRTDCRMITRKVCDGPSTRQEGYPCQQERRVERQVFDHTETADVNINIAGMSSSLSLDERVDLSLISENSLRVSSPSDKVLFRIASNNYSVQGTNHYEHNIRLQPLSKGILLAPVANNVSNMVITSEGVTFDMPKPMSDFGAFSVKLILKKYAWELGGSIMNADTIIDKGIQLKDLKFIDLGKGMIRVNFKFADFGREAPRGKKLQLTIETRLRVNQGDYINTNKFSEDLRVETSKKFKL